MLDWLGVFFSGASLVFQISDIFAKKDNALQIIGTLKNSSDKLRLCKNIHACYQEFYFVHFSPIAANISSQSFDLPLISKQWNSIFDLYIKDFRGNYSLNSELTEQSIQTLTKQVEFTELMKKTIDSLDLNKEVNSILYSFPYTVNESKKMHDNIINLNDQLKKEVFDKPLILSLPNQFKLLLIEADKSIKNLIEIQSRFIRTLK